MKNDKTELHSPTYRQVFNAILRGGVDALKFNGKKWEVANKSPCIHLNMIDDIAEGWRLEE